VKSPERLLGDKAYDSAELREKLGERATKSVIPNRCNRTRDELPSAHAHPSC
jgi:hypothetical protein